MFFFFFKQKTAYEIYQCDWSSDVCSSDLFEAWLEKLAPKNFDYKHHLTGENNGYAHLWRTLMGKGVL